MLKGNLDFRSPYDNLVLWYEIDVLFTLDTNKNMYIPRNDRILFIHAVMIKHSITLIKYDNINVCFDDLFTTLNILVFNSRIDCQLALQRSPIPFHLVTLDEENPAKETTTYTDTLLTTYQVSRHHIRKD